MIHRGDTRLLVGMGRARSQFLLSKSLVEVIFSKRFFANLILFSAAACCCDLLAMSPECSMLSEAKYTVKGFENSGPLSVYISSAVGRMENKFLTAVLAVEQFKLWVGRMDVYTCMTLDV